MNMHFAPQRSAIGGRLLHRDLGQQRIKFPDIEPNPTAAFTDIDLDPETTTGDNIHVAPAIRTDDPTIVYGLGGDWLPEVARECRCDPFRALPRSFG